MEIEELAVALALPAILVFVQLLYPGGSQSGEEREASFNPQIISLFVSIALVSLTVSMALPSSYFLKISILSIIWACASVLSSSLSPMLKWLPFLSGIRPIYHLLPNRFQTFLTEGYQHMRAAIERRLAMYAPNLFASAPSGASSSQPNLDLQGIIIDADASSPSTSTAIQLGSVSESTSVTIEEV